MNKKFTIIDNDKSEQEKFSHTYKVARLNELWKRQYQNAILQAMKKNKDVKIANYPQEDLMKVALSGIKYICSQRDVRRENERLDAEYRETLETSQVMFQLIDAVFMICGYIKLRNLVTTFPIEKKYDGEKWECKDYFYTMEVLSEMDWDKPIGRDNLSELLWDYQNDNLRHAYLEFTSAMSAIYRSQTGKGIAEQWCENMGIGTYSINEDSGIIKNNQTGEIGKMSKRPSYLRIVK